MYVCVCIELMWGGMCVCVREEGKKVIERDRDRER